MTKRQHRSFLVLGFCFVIPTIAFAMSNPGDTVGQLVLRNFELRLALEKVYREESRWLGRDFQVLVLNIVAEGDNYKFRIGPKDTTLLRWWLGYVKFHSASGYFEFKGVPVIVFSNICDRFFDRSDTTRYFDYLLSRPDELVPEIPLMIYDPIVWVFLYKDGKIFDQGTEWFEILD